MKNNKIKKSLKLACMTSVLCSTVALAATDGTIGSTSNGDLDIKLTMPDLVRISAFTDINISYVASSGNSGTTIGTDDLCVYRNELGGAFLITATGDGGAIGGGSGGNAFEVADAVTSTAYTVNFTDGDNTKLPLIAGASSVSGDFDAANESDPTCGGTTNTSVEVVFQNSDLAALPSGTYSGRLTLLVAPD
jgi:hypothetical protein